MLEQRWKTLQRKHLNAVCLPKCGTGC